MKRIFLVFLILSFAKIFSFNTLDDLAIKYGTDKSSKWHDFANIYEKYFDKIKTQKLVFMEIGIAQAYSARMFEEYFQNSKLYFLDNCPGDVNIGKRVLSNRSKCFLIDAGNKEQLTNFVKSEGELFDIIIDDAGHQMKQQITSFEVLFPYVKSGGVYVIEDLYISYQDGDIIAKWPPKGVVRGTINFLKSLIDDLNSVSIRTTCAGFDNCPGDIKKNLSYYQKSIQSIHFYNSICFIFKR